MYMYIYMYVYFTYIYVANRQPRNCIDFFRLKSYDLLSLIKIFYLIYYVLLSKYKIEFNA